MKVVSVKTKLSNKTEFVKLLADIGMDFSEEFWQHDRVFVPRGWERGKNLPRLVVQTSVKAVDKPAKYDFILKRHIEDSGIDVVNNTSIEDYSEAVNIAHQLGFTLVWEVARQRQELEMGENVKIYLDKVEKLPGYYAKIESSVGDDEDPKEVREDLIKTFEVLGQKRSNVVTKMYGEMIE